MNTYPPIPSLMFCLTGHLQPGERYHQDSHSYEGLIKNRVPKLLDWYNMDTIVEWIENNRDFIDNCLSADQIEEIDLYVRKYRDSFPPPPPHNSKN